MLKKVKKRLLKAGILDKENVRHYISPIKENDTFIVSYPKSGNTWVRFILANLLVQTQTTISFRNIEKHVPNIHKSADYINSIKNQKRFIKSHYQSYQNYPRMIYVMRDGRDVMVSYYHYHAQRHFKGTFQEYLRSEEHLVFGSWNDHIMNALAYGENKSDNVLFIRYENLLEAPIKTIKDIAIFCEIPYTEELLDVVNERCDFNNLKTNEKKYGGDVGGKTKTFFRKGTTQQWVDYFTEEDMKHFLKHNETAMTKLELV